MSNLFLEKGENVEQHTKKVIIYTAATGGGHLAAAKSLAEKIEKDGFEVKIVDAFKDNSRILDLMINDGYSFLAKNLPYVYGKIYRFSAKKRVSYGVKKTLYILLQEKIVKELYFFNADLIISTHPLTTALLSVLKKKRMVSLPCVTVVTDLEAHTFYLSEDMDAYVTGSEHTRKSLIQKGIPSERVYCFGIPVKPEFYHRKNISVEKINERFSILVMGGSFGLKNIKNVFLSLMQIKSPLELTVVCGNNRKLKEGLELISKAFTNHKITILGFTENVAQLMDTAEVIISKPGGLTLSEAMNKRIPMVIPFFIPGQEEENAEILSREKVAIVVKDSKELQSEIEKMIFDPSILENMRLNIEYLVQDFSIESTAELIKKIAAKEAAYKIIENV